MWSIHSHRCIRPDDRCLRIKRFPQVYTGLQRGRPNRVHFNAPQKTAEIFVACLVLLFLTACTAGRGQPAGARDEVIAAPTALPAVATDPPAPVEMTQPAPEMPLITMEEFGYRFRFPSEYQVAVHRNTVCLTLSQESGIPGPCHVQNFSIVVEDAGGRMLSQMADEVEAIGNPSIQVKRTGLTISGVEAILVENIAAQDWLRIVVILHDERAYRLVFTGWPEGQLEDSPEGVLFTTIIESFEFLQRPEPDSHQEEIIHYVSAVIETPVYNEPTMDASPVGFLEVGTPAAVFEYLEGNWMRIECPDGRSSDCWVLWDMNTLISYSGPPVILNIPDPAGLKIEGTRTFESPDKRWQVLTTASETVNFGHEEARFYYVEMIVSSEMARQTWVPVSEWKVVGLGQEFPPVPVHWSTDGRYLFYTTPGDAHGACVYYGNIGESFDRLDLTDGTVSVLPPPHARTLLAVSPDESAVAYFAWINGYYLVIRNLSTAYDASSQGSVRWMEPLDTISPYLTSRMEWSGDNARVRLTVADMNDFCQIFEESVWELDISTGEMVEVSRTVFPTPTP